MDIEIAHATCPRTRTRLTDIRNCERDKLGGLNEHGPGWTDRILRRCRLSGRDLRLIHRLAAHLIRLALLPVASISDLAPDPSNRADEIRFQLSCRHLRACATGDKRQAPRQLRAA
jgi:hypothetical protein